MDGSVLAVLAAYQNNLVTSKMMTSQVLNGSRLRRRENTTLDGKELIKRSIGKLSFFICTQKTFKTCLLCTAYAEKTASFYMIVSSYFVIYTVTITKIHCYTLVS